MSWFAGFESGGTQNVMGGSTFAFIMSTFLRLVLSMCHATAGRNVSSLVALVIACAMTAPVFAAKAKKADAAKDSAPVLMSKTGGGDSWADMKELQEAAKKGNPKAETQLGEMLLRGEGIDKDEARAV